MGKKIVHIEFPAQDVDRAERFWEGLGGWPIESAGMEGMDYRMFQDDGWGGAVYPQQGFPGWMQVIAVVDPFTYAVHAFKSLLLKNTGFEAIYGDLGYLLIFSIVSMSAATMLFRRTL